MSEVVSPFFSSPTYQSVGDALLCTWFKCRALSKSSEVCNGLRGLKWVQTCIAWDCHVWCVVLGLKLMKMCNKKQYIYFICTFMCMFYRSLFVLFLLAIVLSVLLRYTDSWLPLWYLQTLLWTVTTFCQVQKDQTNVHNSGILCINWWLFILVSYLSRKKIFNTIFDIWPFNFWRVGYIFICKKEKPRI